MTDKPKITEKDLENPQRFVGEGLGAPEARIIGGGERPDKADLLHSYSKR